MTLHQIGRAIREQIFVTTPEGATGTIASFEDYDWRNYQVTVTLEDGGKVTLSQWDLEPAIPGTFNNEFTPLTNHWKRIIKEKLNPGQGTGDRKKQR